jgi:hypothetical protein
LGIADDRTAPFPHRRALREAPGTGPQLPSELGFLLRWLEREQLASGGDPQPDGLGDLVGVLLDVIDGVRR